MDVDSLLKPMRVEQIIVTVSEDEEHDLPSQFGDDDALLSIAPSETELSRGKNPSINTSSNKGFDSVSSSMTSLMKTSELRQKRTADGTSLLQYQMEDSIRSGTSMSLNINTMGLIGREEETSILRSAFDRIVANSKVTYNNNDTPTIKSESEGNTNTARKEIVLLGGPSGVGKSSIVKDMSAFMEREKIGYFVGGKFNINASDVPYSGVCDALGMICQHIHKDSRDSIPTVRGTLEQELGEESSLLCQLVPELKSIMHDQQQQQESNDTADLDVEELENALDRLRYAFRILMRALSAEFSPLVLFLDDLHWADVSSLQVLDYMISDTQNPNSLMIIGCYRSDEVDENSLLYNKIQSLRDKSSRFAFAVTEIPIAPFAASDVEKIITVAFEQSQSSDDTLKLSELCVKRTLGNPFFVLEFLKMLRNERLIAYDEPSEKWTWDLERIEDATMSTANVVVLLQERMRKLSGQVQAFLQYAAHLGSSFSEETIKIIWQTYGRRVTVGDMEPLSKLLQMVVDGNYLEKLDATHYRWVHDKVQEAALYLAGTLRETHYLDIGTSLYYCLEAKQLEEDLFNVVDLINKGNIKKRPEFANVNLRAAEKARGISAFQAAAKYAAHGIELLKDTRWSQNRPLTLKLYTIGVEMEQVLGNVSAAERYSSEVLGRTELGTMDTLPLKLARASTISTVELKFDEAVAHCLDVLKELGCKLFWSRKLLKVQAVLTVLRTIRRVKKLPMAYFDKLKMMNDEKQKGIATLVSRTAVSTYLSGDIMLSLLCSCKLVEIALDHGVNEYLARSLSNLATATIVVQEDFKAATKFNEMALSLLKKHRRIQGGATVFLAYMNCFLWVRPMNECLPAIWDGYSLAMRSGDTEFSCWSLYATVTIPLFFGAPLPQVLGRCPAVMHQFEEAAQSQPIMILKIIWQMVVNLHDSSCREPQLLKGEIFSNGKDTGTDTIHIATVHLCQSDLLLFYGEYCSAADMALERGDLYQEALPANCVIIFEAFHRAIVLYAAALQTNKKKYKKEAKKIRRMLSKRVVAIANPDFDYFKTMLDAEQFAVDKKHEEADKHYTEAIKLAISRGHLSHAAVFCERHSDFLLRERSDRTKSNEQLKQAIDYYKQWGAEGKVKVLESELASLDQK